MPFINPAQTVQDLRNAVEYLLEHPWIQGWNFDDRGGCCAYGAILVATGDPIKDDRAASAARAFYRVIGRDVALFNDTPERTKDEVIAALVTVADTIERDPSRA